LIEDRDLIESSLRGDQDAFESLVNRYKRLVVHIVHRMIADAVDAEDVYQEIFVKVYEGLPRFRREAKMSTWIGRIAYNTCINHLQKKREVLFGDLLWNDQGAEVLLKSHSSPGEQVERADLAERLETEIRSMPVQFRTILTLYHLQEMSYREIGELMHLPEGTVKSHLFRARKLLRHRLSAKYEEEDLR
jgi:RNA polymerase sigma-70 factor (ECF subfamily)